MRLLLDTNVLISLASRPEQIPEPWRSSIDEADQAFLSVASAWELAIKCASKRQVLDEEPAIYVPRHMRGMRLALLPMTFDDAIFAGALPPHHRDPFDRMLIAQAIRERLTIVTLDRMFARYDVNVLGKSHARRKAPRI